VYGNRVPRKIFGPMREKVAGGWRKLHKGELRNFHASLNIIRVIKLRKMRWVGRIARMGQIRNI
jgi:hypothetical protein